MRVFVLLAISLRLVGAAPSTGALGRERDDETKEAKLAEDIPFVDQAADPDWATLAAPTGGLLNQVNPRHTAHNGDKAPSCKKNSDCPKGYHCKKVSGVKVCVEKHESGGGDPPRNGTQPSDA